MNSIRTDDELDQLLSEWAGHVDMEPDDDAAEIFLMKEDLGFAWWQARLDRKRNVINRRFTRGWEPARDLRMG